MKRYVIQDPESEKYLLDEGGKYILSSTVGNFLTGEGYLAAILKDAKQELKNNNLIVIEFELPPIEPCKACREAVRKEYQIILASTTNSGAWVDSIEGTNQNYCFNCGRKIH